jgi:hypothetical protein
MDAQAWDRSDDPMAMLDAIHGIASERKLRLFSYALCQRLHFTPDSVEDGQVLLARAEQLFDAPPRPRGWALQATEEEIAQDPDTWYRLEDDVCGRFDLAWSGFLEADSTPIEWEGNLAFTDAVMDSWAATTILGTLCAEDPWAGAREAAEVAVTLALRKAIQSGQPCSAAEAGMVAAARVDVCRVLREVFGQPFRSVAINPDWLAWGDGTVPKLARRVYDDRRFDLLPILANALEEAGCTNEDVLTHCHSPGPHVRGCWVVDAVLGRK